AFQAETDVAVFQERLQALLATDSLVATAGPVLTRLPMPTITEVQLGQNPRLRLAQQQAAGQQAETKLERAKLLADLQLGYTNRTLGENHGSDGAAAFEAPQEVMVGLAIPLWVKPQKRRIAAAKLQADVAKLNLQ